MPDYAAQRQNMVESQVRPSDVPDPRIQAAMGAIARERFVPAAKRAVAYAETAIEVVPGRFLLEPRVLAKLLLLADIGPEDRVLDIGGATGYGAAVLSRLAGEVTCLESDADLVRIASEMLPAVGAENTGVAQGALSEGHTPGAPYDVIVIEGGVELIPDPILAQLAEEGRLVAIVQESGQSRAHLHVRSHGHVGGRPDFDAAAPLLPGFRKAVGFVF